MNENIQITFADASNKIAAEISNNNSKFDKIVEQILEKTDLLVDEDVNNQVKYDSVVSIEYLLLRARLESEFEHLKIKQLLSDQSTPAALRGIFMKRSQYLSELAVKLSTIRDDVSTLQKTVYTAQSRSFMK